MTDRVPAHWIKPNESNRLPRRHVIFDCEAHRTLTPHGENQTFRLACGQMVHTSKAGRDWIVGPMQHFSDPASLWQWIESCGIDGRRLVVLAHNLAYDLRVSEAFTQLPALGYSLEIVRLDGGGAWCQWRNGKRSIVCIDTVSWFGVSLELVGVACGVGKRPLPSESASDEVWFDRCSTDVDVLRTAWLRALRWVEHDNIGNWKPTGAGMGWAFLRHRHLTHKILHHGVESVARAERESCYSGRCEAWRHGTMINGPFEEWDFTAAYAQVCEETSVPVRLVGGVTRSGAHRYIDGLDGFAALLHCRITTETPTAPHRGPDGILWPVGTFDSWLWDVEARQVVDAGGTIEVLKGWRYETAPALRQWATWILDTLAANPADVDPVVRLIVKGWSRTTVGRFGAQWSTWERYGEAHGTDVTLGRLHDARDGSQRRMMMVGGNCLIEGERRDADDSATHVLSFVMAACRVKLWAAMLAAGLENVLYVDTDGLIVNPAGARALAAAALPGLRPKTRWRSVEVLGPRQLVLDGKLRASGVPSRSVRTGPQTWQSEVWRSLSASLRAGETNSVTITDRSFRLVGVDRRRLHAQDGSTGPIRLPS